MRATVPDIKLVISTDLSDTSINAFIATANRLVDAYFLNCNYSDDVLKDMEIYWTAHLITKSPSDTTSNVIKSEKVGEAEVVYAVPSSTSVDIKSTIYGETVLLLDSNNCYKPKKYKTVLLAITSFE